MAQSVVEKVKKSIYGHGRGWCFTLKDLSALGSEEAVKVSVFRLTQQNIVRRIKPGLYYYPQKSDFFGEVPPSLNKIAGALAGKYKTRLQPSGAFAANILGFTDQVPAQLVYLTDGESKKIVVDNRQILFKKTTPKNMKMAGQTAGLVVQAFKYIGKDHIDEKKINTLKRKLTEADKIFLKKNISLVPCWIAKIISERVLNDEKA